MCTATITIGTLYCFLQCYTTGVLIKLANVALQLLRMLPIHITCPVLHLRQSKSIVSLNTEEMEQKLYDLVGELHPPYCAKKRHLYRASLLGDTACRTQKSSKSPEQFFEGKLSSQNHSCQRHTKGYKLSQNIL